MIWRAIRFQYQQNINLAFTPVQTTDIEATRNRFISTGPYPTTYDPAGNILSDAKFRGLSYQYDANNRQTSVTGTGVNQTAVYDALGQRIQTTANGATRQMVYDAFGQLIAEYNNGALQRENLYRGGQLLASKEEPTTVSTNLALNKPATQSSTHAPGITDAGKAVDGNTDGVLWNGYAAATNFETNAWWQVDLGSVQALSLIQVWGRTDCCSEMTSNFYVFVSDNPFTSSDLNTTLNQPVVSNFVALRL